MASNSPGQNMTLVVLDISRAPRMIFLVLFMIMTSVGSAFVLLAVANNKKARTIQNLLIANTCIVCLVDCFLNMPLVLGALIADEWLYGHYMCKVNVFFMNLVIIETTLMLVSLSMDRYFTLRFSKKYKAWLCSFKLYILIAYVWLHALVFSIPFLTKAVASTFRPHLHICSATGETSVAFLYVTLLVCFLGPLITTIVFQIIAMRFACKLRYNTKRSEDTQRNYTQMLNESPRPESESHPSCYTRLLLVMWVVLEGPFIITSYTRLYELSWNVDEHSRISYPWIVDAVFLWMKFFFSATFPFVTFFCKKELWQCTKECILCRRNNSIIDMGIIGYNSASEASVARQDNNPKHEIESSSPKAKEKEKIKPEAPHSLAFNIPVLFATSTGICIEESPSYDCATLSPIKSDCVQMFKGKQLDISYPDQEWPEELLGDTSDYDSSCEIDQFSSSQPVSARNVQGTLQRSRSLSDPEIMKIMFPKKAKDKLFSGTSAADSGLDLSGTICLGKSEKSKDDQPYVHITVPTSASISSELHNVMQEEGEDSLKHKEMSLCDKNIVDNQSIPSDYTQVKNDELVEKDLPHIPKFADAVIISNGRANKKQPRNKKKKGRSNVELSPIENSKDSRPAGASRQKSASNFMPVDQDQNNPKNLPDEALYVE